MEIDFEVGDYVSVIFDCGDSPETCYVHEIERGFIVFLDENNKRIVSRRQSLHMIKKLNKAEVDKNKSSELYELNSSFNNTFVMSLFSDLGKNMFYSSHTFHV